MYMGTGIAPKEHRIDIYWYICYIMNESQDIMEMAKLHVTSLQSALAT